jgi:phosphoribosylformylglycinamidine cyclo-ligase
VRNLLRLTGTAGFAIEDPLPVPPIVALVIERAGVSAQEAWEIFNMGCGFVAVVPAPHADEATRILAARHPGTRRIGGVTPEPGVGVAGLRYR